VEAAIVAEMHHAMRAVYLDWVINDPSTPSDAIEPAKTLREEIISASTAYGCSNYSEILIKDCVKSDFAHSNVSPEEVRLFQKIVNQ
jgi:hypothetical protein